MTRKTLCKLVLLEANKIKEFFTQEEIANLNFETLKPQHVEKCIYGQMTGNCNSLKARELIKTLPKHFEYTYNHNPHQDTNITIKHTLNNITEYREDVWCAEIYKMTFSPIEVYITLPDANNLNLIQYLKSEVSELNIK